MTNSFITEMNCKSACVVWCAVAAVCSAATYEYIPGIEYDGEIYVPLNVVAGVRAARSAYPRRHYGGGSDANADATAQTGGFGHGGAGANAKADASAQGGGFAFPGQYGGGGFGGPGFGGHHAGPGFKRPGGPPFGGQGGFNNLGGGQANADSKAAATAGNPVSPGGGASQGGASAGASGGSAADANAQTQTFTGNGFTATSSSASSSSRSQGYGGLPSAANSQAAANAVAAS